LSVVSQLAKAIRERDISPSWTASESRSSSRFTEFML